MGLRLPDDLPNNTRTTSTKKGGVLPKANAVYKKINVRTVFSEDDRVSYEENVEEKNNELKPIDAIREDVLDFAKQYEGKTIREMRKIMTSVPDGTCNNSWCADFVKFTWTSTLGDNLPEWYKDISNKSACDTIRKEADADERAVKVAIEDAKSGDMVLFDYNRDGHADHAGLIDHVEKDSNGNIIVYTEEGNARENKHEEYRVIERTYRSDLDGVYDSTKSILRIYSLEEKETDEKETHENDTHKSFIQRIRSLFQFQDLIS